MHAPPLQAPCPCTPSAANPPTPRLPQVAVFDTAFHQTMPPESFMYALPYELYVERAIRRWVG